MSKKPALWKWGSLSRRQRIVLSWWCKGNKYSGREGIIADGSIRSGKTISMGLSFVLWAMENFKSQNFAMCGKTIESFRRNVLVNLKRQLTSEGYHCKERRSENMMLVSKGNRTNTFYMFGGKDEGSQDLIQGLTLAGVFFDEVALMPQSFVNQATGRCSVDGSKFFFNCNPAGPEHWFYKEWVLKSKQRNLVYLHFTMKDNMTLSQAIRQRYENQYSGVFYMRYIKGLWVMAEGLIYDMFDKKRHVLHKVPELEGDYYVSCDYGIQNATVFLLWRKEMGTNRWICLKEWRYSGREESRQKTVKELVEGLKDMLGGITPAKVIVDPSASALIVELRKNRFSVKKADNDVLAGIADVSTMLQQDRLAFMDCCKETIKEFGSYCWDSKAADRGEDKPVKVKDHSQDAIRYHVRTLRLVKRDETTRYRRSII